MTCHSKFKSRNAYGARRGQRAGLHLAFCILPFLCLSQAFAQNVANVTEIRVEQEGQVVTDPQILGLLETTVGKPLSIADVRESISHLISLGRFDDVQVYQEAAPNGIRLRYVLLPLHPIDRFAFRGMTGLDGDELRQVVVQRFGVAPLASRAPAIVELLRTTFRNRGYAQPRIEWRVEPTHMPDRATLVFDIDAGMRAAVSDIRFEQVDPGEQSTLLGLPQLRTGRPYDADAIQKQLQQYVDALHARGYYEARAMHSVSFESGGAVVTVQLVRGPKVTVAFAGDPLPEKERERLVPIRAEGSVDEDLLEDSENAIVAYLHAGGYRDARAQYMQETQGDQLTITFQVTRGPKYVVGDVMVSGNAAVSGAELRPAVRVKPGEAFVQTAVDTTVGSVRNLYRTKGFTRATVQANASVTPSESADTRTIDVRFAIVEGPKTIVRSVSFTGNRAVSQAELATAMSLKIGEPYSETTVATDRDRVDLEYRNRGYDEVVIQPNVTFSADNTQADVRFAITEGPQALVDHVIIVGNERTSTSTIERALLLKPGEPLGYSARIESQQRLSALGLFRRVRIDELPHGDDTRRDVMVQVEEAPPTTIGYGGGIEVGTLLRNDNGTATERYEFVPRAFFEIGRRNLWGKNRSVNLFSRAGLRSRDIALTNGGVSLVQTESSQGFNEYRLYGTYREPKVFGSRADVLLTGILEQALRSSFNFRTRQARAEAGMRLSSHYSAAGRYTLERTELFDENISESERPLVDRLFPQVRLSKFSGTMIRDTRDDVLDPSHGRWFILDADVAARAFGSQVGFDKVYLQAFSYSQLPTARRIVVALAGRLGAAHGFARVANGQELPPQDRLPASERFFAGGDTTVRGFTLDRLGNARTITEAGFPKGGNSVVILNAELRVNVTRRVQVVGFMDGGNVFPLAVDLDLMDLRGAYGVGARYNIKGLGPVRVDWGLKMHPLELIPGTLERRSVLHVSIGQAF